MRKLRTRILQYRQRNKLDVWESKNGVVNSMNLGVFASWRWSRAKNQLNLVTTTLTSLFILHTDDGVLHSWPSFNMFNFFILKMDRIIHKSYERLVCAKHSYTPFIIIVVIMMFNLLSLITSNQNTSQIYIFDILISFKFST